MKKSRAWTVGSVIALILVGACGSTTPTSAPRLSETEIAATVDAAIQATGTASAALSATVDAAVQATQAAIPASATSPPTQAPPTSTPTAIPTPTTAPTVPPPDSATMSEEELAAAIDAAVAEALASTEQATATTADAANDGTISVEETVTIEIALANAEQAIALAETLIEIYADSYGAYASEALDILIEMEEDLEAMAQAIADILALLQEGSEAASAALDQINAALEIAKRSAAEIEAHSEGWTETLQAELDQRSATALSVQATEIANSRREAIQSATGYIETVRAALSDQRVSPEELSAIALAGANAGASLQAQGGQLGSLADAIDALTAQVARGQWPQAQLDLGALEAALSGRP